MLVAEADGYLTKTVVMLADDECPDWVRFGGMCALRVYLVDDFVAAANVLAAAGAKAREKIVRELSEKYGPPPSDDDGGVECRSNLTGAVTQTARILHWALPGLHVTYTPLVTDCKRGRIRIELETLREIRSEIQEALDATAPRM